MAYEVHIRTAGVWAVMRNDDGTPASFDYFSEAFQERADLVSATRAAGRATKTPFDPDDYIIVDTENHS